MLDNQEKSNFGAKIHLKYLSKSREFSKINKVKSTQIISYDKRRLFRGKRKKLCDLKVIKQQYQKIPDI